MTRFKRRILIGTALIGLVILGLGIWLYYTFFSPTSTALQRAEAFLFRRMQVAQLAEQGYCGAELKHFGAIPQAGESSVRQAIRIARRTTVG